jgi:hypothetical protein
LSFTRGINRDTGQTIALTTWDTDEHGRISAADVLGDIVSTSQAPGLKVEQPELFEVVTPG